MNEKDELRGCMGIIYPTKSLPENEIPNCFTTYSRTETST